MHLQSLKDYAYKITLEVNAKIPYKERLMGKFKFMVDSEERWPWPLRLLSLSGPGR
jgi:hypothetical protein